VIPKLGRTCRTSPQRFLLSGPRGDWPESLSVYTVADHRAARRPWRTRWSPRNFHLVMLDKRPLEDSRWTAAGEFVLHPLRCMLECLPDLSHRRRSMAYGGVYFGGPIGAVLTTALLRWPGGESIICPHASSLWAGACQAACPRERFRFPRCWVQTAGADASRFRRIKRPTRWKPAPYRWWAGRVPSSGLYPRVSPGGPRGDRRAGGIAAAVGSSAGPRRIARLTKQRDFSRARE